MNVYRQDSYSTKLYDKLLGMNNSDLSDLINSLHVTKTNNSVLSLACGTGILEERIFQNFEHYIGVDTSKPMISSKWNEDKNIQNSDIIKFLNKNKLKFNICLAFGILPFFTDAITNEIIKLIYDNLEDDGLLSIYIENKTTTWFEYKPKTDDSYDNDIYDFFSIINNYEKTELPYHAFHSKDYWEKKFNNNRYFEIKDILEVEWQNDSLTFDELIKIFTGEEFVINIPFKVSKENRDRMKVELKSRFKDSLGKRPKLKMSRYFFVLKKRRTVLQNLICHAKDKHSEIKENVKKYFNVNIKGMTGILRLHNGGIQPWGEMISDCTNFKERYQSLLKFRKDTPARFVNVLFNKSSDVLIPYVMFNYNESSTQIKYDDKNSIIEISLEKKHKNFLFPFDNNIKDKELNIYKSELHQIFGKLPLQIKDTFNEININIKELQVDNLIGLLNVISPISNEICQLIYLPYKPTNNYSNGSLFIYLTGKINSNDIKNISNYIYSYFSEYYLDEYMNLVKKYAEKSAKISIMARNLSHNFGSHILGNSTLYDNLGFSKNNNKKKATIKFHHYLQSRFDYISRIISDAPRQYETLFFYSDLLDKYLQQKAVIGTIASDNGYPLDKMKFIVKVKNDIEDKGFITYNYLRKGKNPFFYDEKGKQPEDFLIAIPGGVTGSHAFYTLLENQIRNAVKYSERYNENGLIITIRVLKYLKEVYEISITENLSNIKHKCDINNKLTLPLINPNTGQSNHEGQGLFEIREAARYLNGIIENPIEAIIDDKMEPPRLGYSFKLFKPTLLRFYNIFDNLQNDNQPTNNILQLSNYEDFLKDGSYFTVFIDNSTDIIGEQFKKRKEILEFIEEYHFMLSYRLILFTRKPDVKAKWDTLFEKSKINTRRVKVINNYDYIEEMLRLSKQDKQDQLLLKLYRLWIWAFKPLTNNKECNLKYNILIGFEAGVGQWKSLIKEFDDELVNVAVKQVGQDVWCNSSFSASKFSIFNNSEEKYLKQSIIFDNHGTVFNDIDWKEALFHQNFGLKNSELYQELKNPPTSQVNLKFFLYSLLETALLNVLILDERTLKAMDSDKGMGTVRNLENVNVQLLNKVNDYKIYNHKEKYAFFENSIVLKQNSCPKIQIYKDCDNKINQYDAVIFHHGKFEELVSNSNFSYKKLEEIYKITPVFLWTSGKGYDLKRIQKSKKLNAQFIDFSEVNYSTFLSLNKFELGKSIMSKYGTRKK